MADLATVLQLNAMQDDTLAALGSLQTTQLELRNQIDAVADADVSGMESIVDKLSPLQEALDALSDAAAAAASVSQMALLKEEVDILSGNIAAIAQQLQEVRNEAEQLSDISSAATAASHSSILRTGEIIGAALAEDIEMALVIGDLAEDISAADLNAAAEGEYTKEILLVLQTADGRPHRWAGFAPTVTPAEQCTDAEIGAPTVTQMGGGSPAFVTGTVHAVVTFDTDAGATKTYQDGDALTVTVDVSALAICAGVANFVKTFDVIV